MPISRSPEIGTRNLALGNAFAPDLFIHNHVTHFGICQTDKEIEHVPDIDGFSLGELLREPRSPDGSSIHCPRVSERADQGIAVALRGPFTH